jgi:cobalt transporter subunit CbtB
MDRLERSKSLEAAESARRVNAVMPAILAAFVGLFLIWGVGFAGASVIHNAAHDVRHSAAFPCH